MPDKQLFANNATTTLNGSIDATQTTATVTDATVFPAPLAPSAGLESEYTLITIESELLKITGVSGNVLTVVRAQEGTTGVTHPDTTAVDARVTADSLAANVRTDSGGDRKGDDSVNIQPSRTVATKVASGDSAVAVGADTTASGASAIAIGLQATATAADGVAIGEGASASGIQAIAVGDAAVALSNNSVTIGAGAATRVLDSLTVGYFSRAEDFTAVTTWAGITEAPTGEVWAINSKWGYCVNGWADTGAAEPTGTVLGDFVTDGSVTWYMFEDDGTHDDGIVAIGRQNQVGGGDTVAIGTNGITYGNGNISLGFTNVLVGQDNVLLGTSATVLGRNNTVIGAHGKDYTIDDREVTNATLIGNAVDFSISYACRIVGPDYMPLEDGTFTAATTAPSYSTTSAKEQIFYSAPICAGVSVWVTATSYKHGETVTKTGAASNYSYFARVTGSNGHYGSATSGGAEPTWPTTAGATVADGSITWVCVDRTDIRCYLPDYTRLIPTEVGFIGDEYTASATTEPTISFGVVGTLAKWKAAAITTLLTGAYSRESLTALINTEGSKALGADVTTFGDGVTSGRIYWKGILVETLTA